MASEELKRLCERLGPEFDDAQEPGPYIGVEQLTSKFGAFYEKVRSLVDYKEAHVIRRSAIRRILKRQVYLERATNIGVTLLKGLVSAGYLPNNRVPEAKGISVHDIVRKWMLLRSDGLSPTLALDFAAIEVERYIFPDHLAELVVDAFYASVENAVVYQGGKGKDNSLLPYAACRRSLLNEDRAGLVYTLALRQVPETAAVGQTDQYFATIAPNILRAVRNADVVATDPLIWKVSARLRNRALYYAVLLEVLRSYGKGAEIIFEDEEKLRELARAIIEKKQKQQRRLLRISGRRAVIYLLLTKILLGVVLEWPYEHFILGAENFVALGSNALFHPTLLLLMVTFVGKERHSRERVLDGVSAVVQGKEMKQDFIKT